MFEFLFDYFERETFMKYFRLTVIVCGYLFVRSIYSGWAEKKQVERQVADEEKEKKAKPQREAKEREEKEARLKREANTFGWGKKTRKEVKLNEAYIEQTNNDLRQRHQTAYDAAEDHDIEDLLQD